MNKETSNNKYNLIQLMADLVIDFAYREPGNISHISGAH